MTFLPNHHRTLDAGELHDLAELYARVVDAKSPFTYMHSRGVAQIAVFLAQKAGMSPKEVFLMNIAGLLHDLGKLTVPEEILVKPAALTRDEMAIMKQHTYYSYWWLKPAFGATPIAEWGAFHHERLDGAGYPFHKAEKELGLGCRIVAVSDIFTALREERPYRAGLSWEAIERIMLQQVKGSALDGGITALLFDNKGLIDDKWQELMEKLHA
jgi:HD-GYP domain-containing protein (c-di-GMP phosphodiesterase class II)